MAPGSGGSKGCCPWAGLWDLLCPAAGRDQLWGILGVAALVRSLIDREEEDKKYKSQAFAEAGKTK